MYMFICCIYRLCTRRRYAKSKRKFWLGVGFVKPHMPQVSLSLSLSQIESVA